MFKKIFSSLLLILAIGGCTKDDLCGEDTPTTPLMVIEFRDINDRMSAKAVQNLQILVNNIDSTVVKNSVNDTIVSIPLDTEQNFSSFIFTIKEPNEAERNTDIVTVAYIRDELYVNRACAYKIIYNQLVLNITEEPINENWILDSQILNPVIENENNAHITIFH
jgi:Family of unknown function (DUF6452)